MKYATHLLNTVKKQSPILFSIVIIHLILAVISLAGLFVDSRTLMGVNVWVKPLKFSISGAIYILTIGYYTTLYPYSNLKRNSINNLVSWTLLLEIGIIVYQGSRGVKSHYNQSSLFDGVLFGVMGLLIAVNVLIMVYFIFDTIRLRINTEKSVQRAILFGWIIIVLGSWIGGKMIGQMAHNVGVADGGEGLPLLNWSTVAGDLRVGHFFGLHGLQIIPLFAFWLSKKLKTSQIKQITIVTFFALLYASFIGFVYYQAMRGMPFITL